MIDRLGELLRWTRTPHPSGGVMLVAPHDPGATLRVQPNLRPLQSLRSIVATRFPGATYAIQRIVSDGGEYGALVALDRRALGLALGDDAYTLIEGTGDGIERVVELILRSHVHGDGFDRARMVPYRIAPGWVGVRRPLATVWYAPQYPRDRARLVVCDAIPIASAVAATQELLWPSMASDHTFTDGTFRYRVQLHDGNAEARAVMRDVIATLEPVPRPVRATLALDVFGWLS